MNKKGQYAPQQPRAVYEGISPVLILGLFVFILLFFNGVLNVGIPGWVKYIGVVCIFIGAVLSLIKLSEL